MNCFNAKAASILIAVVFGCFLSQHSEAAERKPKAGKAVKELSETDYKAACKPVIVADITKDANRYKGEKIKITGKILAMDFPTVDTKTNKKITPFKIILSVEDSTHVLPSGMLPVYVTYRGETDSFVYDTITIYAEVYGNDEYESYNIKKKSLPRVDAKYVEKVQSTQK